MDLSVLSTSFGMESSARDNQVVVLKLSSTCYPGKKRDVAGAIDLHKKPKDNPVF